MWINFLTWLQAQGTLTIIVAIGILVYMAYKGIINIPGIKKRKVEVGGNPHLRCTNYNDLLLRIDTAMEARMEIDFILNIERVREQMMDAELVVEEVLSLMKKHYLKMLKGKIGEKRGLTGHVDYKGYVNLLRGLRGELLNYLRYMFRENHIPVTEPEYVSWEKQKIAKLSDKVTTYLNDFYLSNALVDREHLYDSHYGKVNGADGIMTDVVEKAKAGLRRAKIISEEKDKKVLTLKNKIKALLPEEVI